MYGAMWTYYTSVIVDMHAINTPDKLSYACIRICTCWLLQLTWHWSLRYKMLNFTTKEARSFLDWNHPHQQQDYCEVNDFVPRSAEPISSPLTALPLAMEIATAFNHQKIVMDAESSRQDWLLILAYCWWILLRFDCLSFVEKCCWNEGHEEGID